MFCYRCGHELSEDRTFCPECGARQKSRAKVSVNNFCSCEECRKREFFKSPPAAFSKAVKIIAVITLVISLLLSVAAVSLSAWYVYSFEDTAKEYSKDEPVIKKAFSSPGQLSDEEKARLRSITGVDIDEFNELIDSVNEENYIESFTLIADESVKVIVKIIPISMSANKEFNDFVQMMIYILLVILAVVVLLCIFMTASTYDALRRNRIGKCILLIILSLLLTVFSFGIAFPMLTMNILALVYTVIHRVQYRKYNEI